MTNRTDATAAVLDEMVAGIMGVKANKAIRLTPVGMETAMPLDVPGVTLAREGLADVAKDLRRQAQLLLDVADGLDVMLGKPEAVEADAARKAEADDVLAQKEQERRADDKAAAAAGDKKAEERVEQAESFDARFSRLTDEAQAATFAPRITRAGWVCSTHGDEDLQDRTSPKGRKYLACGKCKEFQR